VSITLEELGLASGFFVWQAVLMTVLSFAVGVLGGFVGLALGSMRLPAMLFLGMGAPTAAGTNIIVSTVSAATGSIRHLREGRVKWRIVLLIGPPSIAGAFIGGYFSKSAPESALLLAVGVLVTWQGVGFLRRSRRLRTEALGADARSQPARTRPQGLPRATATAVVGLGTGVLGGAVGLIMGSLRLPALVWLGAEPRVAAGTNLMVGTVLGAAAWSAHALQGQVDYPMMALMASAAAAGSYIGARQTGRVSVHRLVATMGAVLTAAGLLLIWRAFVV